MASPHISKEVLAQAEDLRPVAKKAATALLKHISNEESKKNNLIESIETVNLVLGMRKIPIKGNKGKPRRIALPHSLYPEGDEPRVCLFAKEETTKIIKESMDANPIKGLSKVRLVTRRLLSAC